MAPARRKARRDVYDLLETWRLDTVDPAANLPLSEALWAELGTQRAVLISDLSGFTRITRSHGLLQFLAVFKRAMKLGCAEVERHGGRFLKSDADNLFALFDSAGAAAACAQAMLGSAAEENARVPDVAGHVRFCIGLGFGQVLELEDDAFGDPVNIAFKLGEDVAAAGEILLSSEAAEDLAASPLPEHQEASRSLRGPETVEVGGVSVGYFRLPPRP